MLCKTQARGWDPNCWNVSYYPAPGLDSCLIYRNWVQVSSSEWQPSSKRLGVSSLPNIPCLNFLSETWICRGELFLLHIYVYSMCGSLPWDLLQEAKKQGRSKLLDLHRWPKYIIIASCKFKLSEDEEAWNTPSPQSIPLCCHTIHCRISMPFLQNPEGKGYWSSCC